MTDTPASRLVDVNLTCQNCTGPVQGTITLEGPLDSVEKTGEMPATCDDCGFVHWLTLKVTMTPVIEPVETLVAPGDHVMVTLARSEPMHATVINTYVNGDVDVQLGNPPFSGTITCIPVADPHPFFTRSALPTIVNGKVVFRHVVSIRPV